MATNNDVAGILGAASRDLCRVRDIDAAASALERWAGVVVGSSTTVALWLLEDDGTLRNVFGSPGIAPRSKARREMVLRTSTRDVMDVGPTRASALFPLLVRDEPIGLMEVTASREPLRDCLGPLEVLANQVGVVAEHVGRESRWSSRVASMTRVLELGRRWTESTTDEHVVRSSVRCVHDVVHVPVAGWLAHENDDGVVWRFVGSKRIGNGQRELLAESDLEREQIVARFREATGRSETSVIEASRAVVVLADAGDDVPILAPLASMIDEAMERLEAKRQISRRYQQLDLGLAITAHEIRTPLLGARAALESVRADELWSEANRDLLWRTQRELEELAGTAEGLLRWASTARCLPTRSLDLVPLIRSAAATVDPDAHRVRWRVDAGRPLRARGNVSQLRGAVANLIRNALAYSPPDGVVRVSLSSADDCAIIDVQDEGPGIPEEMQASIFDPFARGPASDGTEGSGLGLFIARRVVEAHDGSLTLEGGPPTTFRIRLPATHGTETTSRISEP